MWSSKNSNSNMNRPCKRTGHSSWTRGAKSERRERLIERRAEEIKVMREMEKNQQKHAQQMQQNHMDFMCMLSQKYGL